MEIHNSRAATTEATSARLPTQLLFYRWHAGENIESTTVTGTEVGIRAEARGTKPSDELLLSGITEVAHPVPITEVSLESICVTPYDSLVLPAGHHGGADTLLSASTAVLDKAGGTTSSATETERAALRNPLLIMIRFTEFPECP